VPFDIVALRYVVLAADTVSFARAAAQFGVKQATLSKRIALLEARMGLKLFERSTRGAVPTEYGLGFVDTARQLLGDLKSLHSSGRALGAGHVGMLGVGYSTSLAAGNMRALIIDYREHFPEVRLVGIEGDRCRLSQALHGRTIDFAVINGDLPDGGLAKRRLWAERVLVVLPEAHALAHKERIYWPDLRSERIITTQQDPGLDLANLAMARLSEPGWRPDVETREISRENLLALSPIGRFVSMTTDPALGRSIPGVVLREIHEHGGGMIHIDYSGYWRSDNASPALARLLELIDDRYPH
jgi:DNA-binding transcriptional LysR family regulator